MADIPHATADDADRHPAKGASTASAGDVLIADGGDAQHFGAPGTLAFTGQAQGAVLYRNATGWVALSPGTSGQVLRTNGAGANPAWETNPAIASAAAAQSSATTALADAATALAAANEADDTADAAAALATTAQNDIDAHEATPFAHPGTFAQLNSAITDNDAVATNDTRLSVQAAGTASIRALGTGATDALPGNHASTTNTRTPTDGSVTAAKLSAATVDGEMIYRDSTNLGSISFFEWNRRRLRVFDHFLHTGAAGFVGMYGWNTTATGAGAATVNQSSGTNYVDSTHPGVIESATGSTATGNAPCSLGITGGSAGTIQLDAVRRLYARTLHRSGTLSSGAQEYTGLFGFADAVSGASTDGVYVDWTSATFGGNYRGVTINNTTSTTLDLGVGPTAATWMNVEIIIDNAVADFRTSTEAAGAPVSRGTIATNLPTGAGRLVGVLLRITKTVGTNNLGIAWDYCCVEQQLV